MALPFPGIPPWRYDRIGTSGRDGTVAPLGVIDTIGGNAVEPLFSWYLRQQVGQNASPVRSNRWRFSGSTSPMRLLVISTARTSSVSASIPMWILRHCLRRLAPCLRTCHSPSPENLIPSRHGLEPVAASWLDVHQQMQRAG